MLTLYSPILQNGQTHSGTSATADGLNCMIVFDHFVELALKALKMFFLVVVAPWNESFKLRHNKGRICGIP